MPKNKSPRKKARVPSLRRCNGRGFVELCGVRHYLGPWGKAETEEAYRRKIGEWLEAGRRLPAGPSELTVVELCDRYIEFAQAYYRRANGTETSTVEHVRVAIRVLRRMYGSSLAAEFGPLALRAVRQSWIDDDLARKTVNTYTAEVRRMFKWAASREIIPPSSHHGLETVEGLRRGRSEARETKPVEPVALEHIEAVKCTVSRQVRTMIDLQLLCGARSGEVVGLRARAIDTTGEVWTVRLQEHKTAHVGRSRTIYLGPRAQTILRPFMLRQPDTPMFSPREAETERHSLAEGHRKPNQKPNPRKTDRELGTVYTVNSYRRAIERACLRAKIDVWTPHQLRHNAATAIRHRFGLEAAQIALGHSRADVTQVYAERDERVALQVAREVG